MQIPHFVEIDQHPKINQLLLGLLMTLLTGTLAPVIGMSTSSTSTSSTSSTTTATTTTSTTMTDATTNSTTMTDATTTGTTTSSTTTTGTTTTSTTTTGTTTTGTTTTGTSTTGTTTTGTSTTGTTTTTEPATTTLSMETVFATFAIDITMSGITTSDFTTAMDDFKSSVASSVNGYCNDSQDNARQCCGNMNNYSPTNQQFTMSSKVMIGTGYPMAVTGTSNIVVKCVLEKYEGNALCASGTMARRKRSVNDDYLSAETFQIIMSNEQETFASSFSIAASSTLGESVTVTVVSVTIAGSGNDGTKLASSWTVATWSLFMFIVKRNF